MNFQNQKVILIGGGIGGMTAALALAKKNIPVQVLEQAPYFRESGAGIMLCPNVFKVYDYLEVAEQVKEISFFPEELIYADGVNGFEFLKIPMGKTVEKRFQFPYGSVHREEFLRVLVAECRKYPLIELVTSARIVEVKEENGKVHAFAEDGKKFSGDALVGCDGLWSMIRPYILDNQRPRPSGHITHRGMINSEKLPSHLRKKCVYHWDRPGGHMVFYPIGTKGLYNIVAVYQSKKTETAEQPEGDPEELFASFAGSQPEILELLQFVDTSKKWMLYDREPSRIWSKGKMTLLGDAAHPTQPHLTQGAGMAIEDAVVLAEKISTSGGDYAKAFQKYQEARYLRTAHVQIFSKFYGELHHIDGIAKELKNSLISKRSQEENFTWLSEIYSGLDLKKEAHE